TLRAVVGGRAGVFEGAGPGERARAAAELLGRLAQQLPVAGEQALRVQGRAGQRRGHRVATGQDLRGGRGGLGAGRVTGVEREPDEVRRVARVVGQEQHPARQLVVQEREGVEGDQRL